jgi:formylglycine-generating enzyme required for sulfatase activity
MVTQARIADQRNTPYQPELALIPAGWFLMGSTQGQDNEQPVHRVWLDEFHLAVRQVTNSDYGSFLSATGNNPPPFWNDPHFNGPQQPVVGVSWFEAVRYCEWLSSSTSRNFRLPSEAEWERAARGDVESKLYPWGDASPQSRPNYDMLWLTGPEPVGRSQPNQFGLHEMCENVHEWCSDWFAPNYYQNCPARNPKGPSEGTRRSSRGGSWRHHVKISRCSARSSIPPEFQYADYGFRVACDLAGSSLA